METTYTKYTNDRPRRISSRFIPKTEPSPTPRLVFPIGELILQNITDSRALSAVHQTYLSLAGEIDATGSGLSYEGFRQMLIHGRLTVDNLPRLFEAMEINQVDPMVVMAAIEAACLPRDPEMNGKLADELAGLAMATGDIAARYKTNGDSLEGYSNSDLRAVMATITTCMAVCRRLMQECTENYNA